MKNRSDRHHRYSAIVADRRRKLDGHQVDGNVAGRGGPWSRASEVAGRGDGPARTVVALVAAEQQSALGHDSETCWAIWLLKELSAKLPKTLSDSVLENCSGFVLAFLAHFPREKMALDRKLPEKLRAALTGDPYAGAFWPLSLELTHLTAIPRGIRQIHSALCEPSIRPRFHHRLGRPSKSFCHATIFRRRPPTCH
jgi:hypothetical protein